MKKTFFISEDTILEKSLITREWQDNNFLELLTWSFVFYIHLLFHTFWVIKFGVECFKLLPFGTSHLSKMSSRQTQRMTFAMASALHPSISLANKFPFITHFLLFCLSLTVCVFISFRNVNCLVIPFLFLSFFSVSTSSWLFHHTFFFVLLCLDFFLLISSTNIISSIKTNAGKEKCYRKNSVDQVKKIKATLPFLQMQDYCIKLIRFVLVFAASRKCTELHERSLDNKIKRRWRLKKKN